MATSCVSSRRCASPLRTSILRSTCSIARSVKFDTIVKGGNVVTPAGAFIGDVGITGEKISALGVGLDGAKGTKVIDAAGYHVIPGVLDVHVHLELPFCGT